jgi:predicted O-linked N-acetylglucosamine transferase (SPINDLY family)
MSDAATLLTQAIALHRQGALAEAAMYYREVLRHDPTNADASYAQAQIACQRGDLAKGVELARRLLAIEPGSARTHTLIGKALVRLDRIAEALTSLDAAIAGDPNYADAYGVRGDVLAALGRTAEAIASYDRAVALVPDAIENWCNRGALLHELAHYEDALTNYDRVVTLAPDFVEGHLNRGNTLRRLGRDLEALASYERALSVQPTHVDACVCQADTLRKLQRYEDALAAYRRVLVLAPGQLAALMGQGVALIELGRHGEALASFDSVLAARPDHLDALHDRGFVLDAAGRYEAALVSYGRVLQIDQGHATTLFNQGLTFEKLGRFSEAARCFEQLLEIQPQHQYALGELFTCRIMTCDWAGTAALMPAVFEGIAKQDVIISPFELLAVESTPAQQLACANNWVRHKNFPVAPRRVTPALSGKLRVAYLSADFRAHPITYLITELFETHDRTRFEILGISYGPDDGSALRARVAKSFDRFIDVRARSDDHVVQLLRDLDLQIIVDLNGHTSLSRLGILARRPAPIQVSFLGFPATTAASFLDYVIADKTVLPFDQQPYFTEKIVHLPDSYYVNESNRPIASRTAQRNEASLPAEGFVFCCFNQSYKITARVFDVWMRLLRMIDGSVLWLLRNESTAENLRCAATACGIDPNRIIFADKVAPADHLARHQLADLFLDTLPYNAHTTACDALWAGLPVLTCLGQTFASRVAASILLAAGLPELVTCHLEEYEAVALKLAREPAALHSFRQRLAASRRTCPLFDTRRFRHHIEAAYMTMYEISRRGEAPHSFSVDPIAG